MKHVLTLAALTLLSACARGPTLFTDGQKPAESIEAQYARALGHLDPSNKDGSIDAAVIFLDAYLAHAGRVERRTEAAALRRLAGSAQQLAKVEATLQQARASASEAKTKSGDGTARTSEDDSIKEIQRLKDELAEANSELERIRKRLATPKP